MPVLIILGPRVKPEDDDERVLPYLNRANGERV